MNKISFANIKYAILLLIAISSSNVFAIPFTLNVEAYIDGKSTLKIQGDSIWWHHYEWSAPGQWPHGPQEAPLPTVINGEEWYPDWTGISNYRCNVEQGQKCETDPISGLIPALSNNDQIIDFTYTGRRNVFLEGPTAGNDFITSIIFDDNVGGADWYSFELVYEVNEVPEPAMILLFGLAGISLTISRKRKK